jgi:hypothetical protein
MKRLLLIFLVCLITTPFALSDNLGELKTRFRYRLDELDVNKAFFTDSALTHWLNMSQEAVVTAGNLLPRCTTVSYPSNDSITLGSNVRRVTDVMVQAQSRWTVIPPGGTGETSGASYYVSWLTETQPQIVLTLGPLADSAWNVIYDADNSTQYVWLGRYIWDIKSVLTHTGDWWTPMMYNQGFVIDTLTNYYSIHRVGGSSGQLETYFYYQAPYLSDGDTIRIFYRRTAFYLIDKLRVCFSMVPTVMTGNSTECDVADDLEHFIIEEAIGYYFQALRMYGEASRVWQQVRMDMGLIQPGAPQR